MVKVWRRSSGGILRSPTTAWILSQKPYGFNTRAVGTEREALIQISQTLMNWADVVLCMENKHWKKIKNLFYLPDDRPHVHILDVPDMYEYRDPELVKLIRKKVSQIFSPQ